MCSSTYIHIFALTFLCCFGCSFICIHFFSPYLFTFLCCWSHKYGCSNHFDFQHQNFICILSHSVSVFEAHAHIRAYIRVQATCASTFHQLCHFLGKHTYIHTYIHTLLQVQTTCTSIFRQFRHSRAICVLCGSGRHLWLFTYLDTSKW